eukprot:TRINITY_DN13160_c0_g1_i1.p1 TRINITY_DN13160_c0_g1~~TRINITY_DN13160_c0_g1_i1.p1  ORF type:complete len:240 (-),score=48.95 TRINITY_DN13160_c0_g1_i1:24-665(-)
MALSYAGAEYESTLYPVHYPEDGSIDKSAWFNVKPEFVKKNPLMNLPYLIDGDLVITQSNPCLMHVARKFGLVGTNESDLVKVEQAVAQAFDFRNDSTDAWYGKSVEDVKKMMESGAFSAHYTKFEAWLAHNGTKFTALDKPTIGDFALFEMIDSHEIFAKHHNLASPLASCPKLAAFYKAILELPELKSYFEGSEYKLPCNQAFSCHALSAQ